MVFGLVVGSPIPPLSCIWLLDQRKILISYTMCTGYGSYRSRYSQCTKGTIDRGSICQSPTTPIYTGNIFHRYHLPLQGNVGAPYPPMYGTYDPYSMYNQYHDMTDQENELIDVLTSCIIHSLYITHLSIYVGTPIGVLVGSPIPHQPTYSFSSI